MDSARERRTTVDLGELAKVVSKGQIAAEQMEVINPYFEELKQGLHEEWEKCGLMDGAKAKILHFHIKTVNELQRLMNHRVIKGKQARKKLEEVNGN